jgi:GTP cyclohydrolase II
MSFAKTAGRAWHALCGSNRATQRIKVRHGVCRLPSARLPTALGEFEITIYRDRLGSEHLVLRMGDVAGPPPLVRLHSECLTGDVFGSVRCDCGEQLQVALRFIADEGRGLLVYLRQEGRGIGLGNKIRAYALQDKGMDTVEANLHLGFPADGRSYVDAASILKDQGCHAVRLLTNNPHKLEGLKEGGIRVVERVSYDIPPRAENHAYLQTKASKLGHLLQPYLTTASDDEVVPVDIRDSWCSDDSH